MGSGEGAKVRWRLEARDAVWEEEGVPRLRGLPVAPRSARSLLTSLGRAGVASGVDVLRFLGGLERGDEFVDEEEAVGALVAVRC